MAASTEPAKSYALLAERIPGSAAPPTRQYVPEREYLGVRTPTGVEVLVRHGDGRIYELPLCLHVRDHSPTGFEWGYAGSGPSQLALALCCDALSDNERAARVYQDFKFAFIAQLPRGS
ncbi:MAG TPA: DUF6166 domain-containing protein, partial [Terriglobales bacterium]|nr:DUF6166 domain-containing protein [Terriglobales bacterium]